ncbi:acyl-CoA synthetase [Mycobacterium sp. E802]|uniref:AMP-binding protein n=1 Tax=Mycobacterium sp. E802 TaxID=1834152 RepID=UPI000800B153|nr:AMP-binding protein [Mycobacterium sp. E802]OBG89394.1 acyl-CoA synthetase [Mycobacterium sp. E802]
MIRSSITDVLRERASLQPDAVAFTFLDYDVAQDGVAHTLTWSQLSRRVLSLAYELRLRGSVGDRAVILAPQGLDYIVAFLGSLHAGLIGVPLSLPAPGVHDERVTTVLRDTTPTIILTTSSVSPQLVEYATATGDHPVPTLLEIDTLDLDARRSPLKRQTSPETAYLQYTSGSTRSPAGVMVSHRNLTANFEQVMAGFFRNKIAPPETTAVSWLPLYHDMGLMLGLCAPLLGGWHTVFTTPMSFLARPARWLQLLASHPAAVTAAPNFAFDLAAKRTSNEDLAGLTLDDVRCVLSGSERVHEGTLRRFAERFAGHGFRPEALRPCYGLAEATLFVATREPGVPPHVVRFESEKLAEGRAEPCESATGTALVSYGRPTSPTVRIVDPQTRSECPSGTVGEIWVLGENVCAGYWRQPERTTATFDAEIVDAPADTPTGSWLRTGDLGFISEGELFIVGRIKDVVIIRGRNHYPDDIEATIQEITGARAAAISVEDGGAEQLVVIAEVKTSTDDHAVEALASVEREVRSAIAQSHGLNATELLLVPRGSIPITTSGKVRRTSCAEQFRNNEFSQLVNK